MRKITLVTIVGCVAVVVLAGALAKYEQVQEPSNDSDRKRLEAYEQKDGKSEAERDWLHGTPRWITYGGPAFDQRPGTELLRQKFGLNRDHVAYCATTPAVERYTKDYNHVIFMKLVAIYGDEFLRRELSAADVYPRDFEVEANQAPVPTATSVTPAADAPVAPAAAAAQL